MQSPPPTEPTPQPDASNWRVAAVDFLSARLELFQLEATTLVVQKVRKIAYLAICIGALFFTWVCLLAGSTPLLASHFHQPWHHIILFYAAGHFLLAMLCLCLLRKRPTSTPFAHTREELQRDRAWIANL